MILFIVESKGKIDKISKLLGSSYRVVASNGIFRDLDPKPKGGTLSVDIDNNFEPIYIITKPDIVAKLKSANKGVSEIYIATDLDREGDGIAQSILDILKPKKYKRLLFNAINKRAIDEAIATAKKTGGEIDADRVSSQKARRVLDRLFGYMISPLLQRKLGGKLSAGRVQSVAARLVIDRENDINNFIEKNQDSSHFKARGIFGPDLSHIKSVLCKATAKDAHKTKGQLKGTMAQIPLVDGTEPNAKVIAFMKRCIKSTFRVRSVEAKAAYRSPSAPFTTDTLQQEAARKLGMSLDTTMKTAQKLYEGGYITYMRTDSVSISPEGHTELKEVIESEYGEQYYHKTEYKNKSSSSQEAHECCRPVDPKLKNLDNESVDSDQQKRLYKLIWQRTVASQMSKAKLNITTIQIDISKFVTDQLNPFYYFQSQIEKVVFMGFMMVYVESVDDAEEDPEINRQTKITIPKTGTNIPMVEITATQEYLKPPYRYTQASLVKKLKELDIGRPATYVNTIKTIIDRQYVKIGDVPGIKKPVVSYKISPSEPKTILEDKTIIQLGHEKNKMYPTSLGREVNNYLMDHFDKLLDYEFTANMELDLDRVAQGELNWHKLVREFYEQIKPTVDALLKQPALSKQHERILGTDSDGVEIIATKTVHGPVVKKKIGSKFVYAKIYDPDTLDNITLDKALDLLQYPKLLGKHKNVDVYLHKGSDNFYLKYDNVSYPLPDDLKTDGDLTLSQAKTVIDAKLANRLAEFTVELYGKPVKAVVLDGPFGPYIQIQRGTKKVNFSLKVHNIDPADLTEAKVLEIITTKRTIPKKKGPNKSDSTRSSKTRPGGNTYRSKKSTTGRAQTKTRRKTISGSKTTRKR